MEEKKEKKTEKASESHGAAQAEIIHALFDFLPEPEFFDDEEE